MPQNPNPKRRNSFPVFLSLCTAVAFVILVALGTWQVKRLAWKESLIAQIQTQQTSAVRDINAIGEDYAGYEYRTVRARGTFLHDKHVLLQARTYQGQLGVHVITPFVLNTGATVLVNRGWAPTDAELSQPQGSQLIRGTLRLSPRPTYFTPTNQPAKNQWVWLDIPTVTKVLQMPDVRPFYLEMTANPKSQAYPIGGQAQLTLPNNHLSYAITWYGLGVGLLLVYGAYIRSYRKGRK